MEQFKSEILYFKLEFPRTPGTKCVVVGSNARRQLCVQCLGKQLDVVIKHQRSLLQTISRKAAVTTADLVNEFMVCE